MPDSDNNRRAKIRVDFQTRIVIQTGDPPIELAGDSKNLSLRGIFVETGRDVALNSRCHVQVFLAGTDPPLAIEVEGAVARKAPNGFAVAFDSMDLESYTELKNVVRYNTENPDDVY